MTISKGLVIVALILAIIALLGIATTAPLLTIAVVCLCIAMLV